MGSIERSPFPVDFSANTQWTWIEFDAAMIARNFASNAKDVLEQEPSSMTGKKLQEIFSGHPPEYWQRILSHGQRMTLKFGPGPSFEGDFFVGSDPLSRVLLLRNISYESQARELLEEQERMLFFNMRSRSLYRVASGIAHEVNNPLATLIGSLSLLTRAVEEQGSFDRVSALERLKYIQNSADRITSVVRSLNTFSTTMIPAIPKSSRLEDMMVALRESCSPNTEMPNGIKIDVELLDGETSVPGAPAEIVLACYLTLRVAAEAASHDMKDLVHVKVRKENGCMVFVVEFDELDGNSVDRVVDPIFGLPNGALVAIASGIIEAHNGTVSYARGFPSTVRLEIPV